MEASNEAQEYINVTQGEKKASAVANTKSDVQTNISLLIEENNQLLNNYTELLLENEELHEKLENIMWILSKICIDGNTHNSFNMKNPELPNNLLQELADTQRELGIECKSPAK